MEEQPNSGENRPASDPPAPRPLDRFLASICAGCPVCRRARSRGEGLAHRFVKNVEGSFCPFCRAYERVHGRKSFQQPPEKAD